MYLSELDKPLVKAFLEREANDFGSKNAGRFADYRMEKITEELAKYEGKTDFIHIISLSNAGCISRKLTISPPNGQWDIVAEINIYLCTCGIKEHWGNVEIKPMHYGKEINNAGNIK